MRLGILAIVGSIAIVRTATLAAPPCAGDCSGDGRVSIDELTLGVDVALGGAGADSCAPADLNGDEEVSVDELVRAVNDALVGCPSFVGTFSSTVALDDGETASLELEAGAGGTIEGTLIIHPAGGSSAGGGAGAPNVPITGSFDVDTGEFSIDGSYVAGGVTIPIHISGTLPGHSGVQRPFMLQIGSFIYTGQISSGTPTPTPTPTPIEGTRHDITVGGPNVAFDPEFLQIDVGDTVVWTWIGGPHSVRSAPRGPTLGCTPDGRFASGVRSSGTFAYTFTEPGEYPYYCDVPNHCGTEFESAIIVVRGTPSPTPTPSATITPTPTETPTPETIGGISIRMIGTFAGKATIESTGNQLDARIRIEVVGGVVMVTDLTGFIFGVNPLQFMVASPTMIFFHQDFGGGSTRDVTLEPTDEGGITGIDERVDPFMPGSRVLLDLTRES